MEPCKQSSFVWYQQHRTYAHRRFRQRRDWDGITEWGLGIYRGSGASAIIEVAGNGNTLGTSSFALGQDGVGSAYVWQRANNIILFGTNATERMRIDTVGNVLINTTTASGKFNVLVGNTNPDGTASSSTQNIIAFQNSTAGNFGIWPLHDGGSPYDGGLAFLGNIYNGSVYAWKERMRIDSSGNLLVGTTSSIAAANFQVVGGTSSGTCLYRNSSSTAGKFWRLGPDSYNNYITYNQNGTGVYLSDGGTSWIANSDERLKTDLVSITNAASKVNTLRAVTGRYKTDEAGTSRAFLIAQDVQKVLPEAVSMQGDEQGTLGVSYTEVIPLLVAAINELNARISTLEAK